MRCLLESRCRLERVGLMRGTPIHFRKVLLVVDCKPEESVPAPIDANLGERRHRVGDSREAR